MKCLIHIINGTRIPYDLKLKLGEPFIKKALISGLIAEVDVSIEQMALIPLAQLNDFYKKDKK